MPLPKIGKTCAYRDCPSKYFIGMSGNPKFFSFPKDNDMCQQWLKLCGREDLSSKSLIDLNKSYRLCENHFESHMYTGPEKKRLLVLAEPKDIKSIASENACYINFNEGDLEDDEPPVKLLKIDTPGNSTLLKGKVNEGASTSSFDSLTIDIPEDITKFSDTSNTNIRASLPLLSPVQTQTDSSLSQNTPRKKKLHIVVKGIF